MNILTSWNSIRIKDIVVKIGSGVTPKGGSNVYTKEGIPFLRSQNVHNDGLRLNNVSYITEELSNKMSFSLLKPYDILINITGASIGRTCLVPKSFQKGNISQHIAYLRLSKKINQFFLSYYLQSHFIYNYIMREQAGASKEAFNLGQIARISFLLPPLKTQQKIATYLDTQTQKIDKEINLLEQKIEKYKELKQTLINETVLRGLDKGVELKDSGVEWIGEIPKGWEVKRVKEIFDISRGRVIAQTELKDIGYPVYSSQTKNNGCMGFIETYDFDDYLITWTTDGVNAGSVFLRRGKFSCTNICGTLRLKRKNMDLRYLEHSVQIGTINNKRIDTNGAKIMSNEMGIIKITIPPLNKQTQIATYLDEKTQKIDNITQTITKKIELLKEFRKTLVNDVVTGRVKVE